RLPDDPSAPCATQDAQSFTISLSHLGVDTTDSLALHCPSRSDSLDTHDHAAWRAYKELASAGKVRVLGISNVTARQVHDLVQFATIAPAFVQNRCYAQREWDRAVRDVCAEHQIVYQAFSLLTANRHVVASAAVTSIATQHRVT